MICLIKEVKKMLLFELFASLGLDMTSFREQSGQAIKEGETVADTVSDSFTKVQKEAEESDRKLTDLEKKSETTNSIVDGLVQATGEIIEAGVDMLLEFGAQSIETAAGTGSKLAEEFNAAKGSFETTVEALKMKAGNALLPIITGFYELGSAVSGVSDSDRLLIMLQSIEEYEFANIEQLRTSLDGVFGRFEQADGVEAANIGDLTGALQSQADYWTQYADTLEALQRRNIDPQFLSDIADGSAESLQTLKALENADDAQLRQLLAAYEAVEETKNATLQGLNDVRISMDEELLAMTQGVEDLVVGMDQEEAARANIALTESGVTSGLASMSAAVGAWVSNINGQLAQIGNIPAVGSYAYRLGVMSGDLPASTETDFSPKASGLSFVPYDGYRAELHYGEEVLTRREAEEHRSGRESSSDNTAVVEEIRSLRNAILSLTLTVDRREIGRIASEEIAREAGVY